MSLTSALVLAAGCADHGPSGPQSLTARRASFSVLPSFQHIPVGGPTIRLARIVGVLTPESGETATSEARFVGDSAVLAFDVQFVGNSEDYTLELTAFDAQGVIVFHSVQKITVKPGVNDHVPSPTLVYVAPDANVTVIHVSPASSQLTAGGGTTLSVTGAGAGGQAISPVRVGWSSRDPSVATVDENGTVVAGAGQGSTWIVARTAMNVADSAFIKVRAPVAKVTVSPAAISMSRGQSSPLTAELRDAGNHLIDDRTPVWTTSDQSIATVSASGVVQGVKVGSATITATAEGKTGSATVQVLSPVDHVELTPSSLTLTSIGQTSTLTAKIVARTGASVDGIVTSFATSNGAVASVDSKGVVTAVGNGSAIITASADGISATASVSMKQTVATVTISPKIANVSAIGESRTYTVAVADAAGNPIQSPAVVWSSSDPTIATVSDGVAVGKRAGFVTITASVDGKSDAATFGVNPVARFLIVTTSKAPIAVGESATISAQLGDANGFPLGPATATFTTTTPTTIQVSGNVVTGLQSGTGHIVANGGGFTGTVDIKVSTPTSLTIVPSTIEKMPNGFGFLAVTNNTSNYSWTVNGIAGGNATFGTIDVEGFYKAPASVPTPATFDICAVQTSPSLQGCSHATIRAIPSAGGDIVVINDVNGIRNADIDFNDDRAFYKNVVNFVPVGARAAATKVVFRYGNGSQCGNDLLCSPSQTTTVRSDMASVGITSVVDDTSATVGAIPLDVRVVFLMTPTIAYSFGEIDNLKAFAAGGGRIVFIGENSAYYSASFGIENDLLFDLGSEMTISDGSVNCTSTVIDATHLRPHQLTTGIANLYVPCGAGMTLGANDYAVALGFASATGTFIPVIGVAKVDVVLSSSESAGATMARARRSVRRKATAVLIPPTGRDTTGYGPTNKRP